MTDKKTNQTNSTGALIGGTANLLGGLLTLKSQKDLINERLRKSRMAQQATEAASRQARDTVVQSSGVGGGLGVLQGLRSAERMQRQSLPDVQRAAAMDTARQDRFDFEQRQRREKLGAGIGNALAGLGTTLATSGAFSGGDEAAGTTQSAKDMETLLGKQDPQAARGDSVAGAVVDDGSDIAPIENLPMPNRQVQVAPQAAPQAAVSTLTPEQQQLAASIPAAVNAGVPTVQAPNNLPAGVDAQTLSDLGAMSGQVQGDLRLGIPRAAGLPDPNQFQTNLAFIGMQPAEIDRLMLHAADPARKQLIDEMIAQKNVVGLRSMVQSLQATGGI